MLPSPSQRRTLFWKVLALVLLTALAATTAIWLYLRYALRDSYDDLLREQIGSYLRLVADGVGSPPDTGHARLLSRQFPIDIAIEGLGVQWRSLPTLPAGPELVALAPRTTLDQGDSILFRADGAELYGIVRRPAGNIVVHLRTSSSSGGPLPVLALILVTGGLIYGAYLVVQRLVRPVGDLMRGVEAVANENFEYQVPVSANDELGQLARAFNAMAQRVAAIIASKRRLLFDVSHELRSPLTRMNVALAMMPEGKTRTSLERNIRELNTMITELLENERLAVLGGKLVVEKVDVVKVVRGIIETFGYDERRIRFDALNEHLEITADQQRMIVAIRNVISNALKYSTEEDGPVRVSVFPDDNSARIVIADQGSGIPLESQKKVFEPFYRTDQSRTRSTGGFGLGLALTKSIVEAHGGSISLASAPGSGTTITMFFPCQPGGRTQAVRALQTTEARS